MPRKNVEFQTSEGLTLRGWLYTPTLTGNTSSETKFPCMIMVHGWAGLKDFGLDKFAESFIAKLPIACLLYDHRSFGGSDTAPGQPQFEIIPSVQISDFQDAITYLQGLDNIESSKIGVWGSSYAAGHVVQIAATDKRVKACICLAPVFNAAESFGRLIRPDMLVAMHEMFKNDRLSRAAGQPAATMRVTDQDPLVPSCLPSAEAYAFYTGHEAKLGGLWKNEVTIRSVEAGCAYNASHWIARIAPTPLLVVIAKYDTAAPVDLALSSYNQACEPKQLVFVPCEHFDIYAGPTFDYNAGKQIEFLREHFCT
jgi:dienelactone hydrolase